MDTERFYAGFEGEPAILLELVNGDAPRKAIRVWEGYFDGLMRRIRPEPQGWTGLALPYNLCEGWYLGPPWRVENVREALAQWEALDLGDMPDEDREIHAEVLGMLRDAAAGKGDMWITYE